MPLGSDEHCLLALWQVFEKQVTVRFSHKLAHCHDLVNRQGARTKNRGGVCKMKLLHDSTRDTNHRSALPSAYGAIRAPQTLRSVQLVRAADLHRSYVTAHFEARTTAGICINKRHYGKESPDDSRGHPPSKEKAQADCREDSVH